MSLLRPLILQDDVGVWDVDQPVPSGQSVELFEVLLDVVGAEDWVRFRFLASDIGAGPQAKGFEEVQLDFEHLCHATALPYLEAYDLAADVVVIALSDREVPFGQPDPEATQYIEAFRVQGNACVLEGLW